jgi:hypothetical protein
MAAFAANANVIVLGNSTPRVLYQRQHPEEREDA